MDYLSWRSAESKPAGLWGIGKCVLRLLGKVQGEQGSGCKNHRRPSHSTHGEQSPDLRPWRRAATSRPQTSRCPAGLFVPVCAARGTTSASQNEACRGLSPTENASPPRLSLERKPTATCRKDFQFIWSLLKASSFHTFFFFWKV